MRPILDEPTLSIIVATHNRPRMLRSLMESIRAHRPKALEAIIVVDDSSPPVPIVEEFRDLPLEHIILARRAFLSRARNIGARAAKSDLLYFIDDDNLVTADTFRPLQTTMSSNPDIGALVPAVLYASAPQLVWVYATPLAPNRWGHSLIGRNRPRNPAKENRLLDTDALPNAFLIRRSALLDVGGFNEAMGMSSSADLALRLKTKGWRVAAHTGARTYHDVAVPGRAGYWSEHGAKDPDRVYNDVVDWFRLMRTLHPRARFFRVSATTHALRFLLPNSLAYFLLNGLGGWRPFRELVRGYLDGIRVTE